MADGVTHARVGAWVGALGAGATWGGVALGLLPLPLSLLPYALAGWAVGVLVTPDLDMTQRTREEARLARIPLVGWLWRLAWWPYAAAIPHRSWLSHGLVVGTLGRAAYLLVIAEVIAAASGHSGWVLARIGALSWLLVGWMIQDGIHAALDL